MQHVNHDELQHLITVSTGFIDTYVIECDQQPPMLLPQNIVLSALDSSTQVTMIDWHERHLAVYAVHDRAQKQGVALVIEGEQSNQPFALMCNAMPKTLRLRISEVVDDPSQPADPVVYQYVRVGEQRYHVPNLSYIEQSLY